MYDSMFHANNQYIIIAIILHIIIHDITEFLFQFFSLSIFGPVEKIESIIAQINWIGYVKEKITIKSELPINHRKNRETIGINESKKVSNQILNNLFIMIVII